MTDWDRNRAALRHHLKTEKLEDFLRWSTVEKTMFVGDVGFVYREFEEMLINNPALDYETYHRLDNALYEPKIGNPKLLWDWTSGNLIHQLYHLKQWLDRSGKTIDQLSSIVEVGAGYGAMALICHRLGFRGRYYIIDLPELEHIQAYYLGQTIPEARSHIHWLQSSSSIKSCDLLIACHSIGEMTVVVRDRLLSQIDADAYLFASSYEFEGVDNATWLRQFADGKPGYEWAQWAHPYQENALYSVGVKL